MRLNQRKPPLIKRKRKKSVTQRESLTSLHLVEFKNFCVQCLNSLRIEKGFKVIDANKLENIVYSPTADVIYIYIKDKTTANLLMETLNHWFCHTDPYFKGSVMDEVTKHNTYIIELNYMNKETIQSNKEKKLTKIIV